ncbi:hypothetical protein D3C80_1446940 [compost metagenome]
MSVMLAYYRGQLKLLLLKPLQLAASLCPGAMQLFNIMYVHRNFFCFQLFSKRLEVDRLLRLLPQRTDLILKLGYKIMNTQQILLRLIQLLCRLALARFIFYNTG